MSRLVDARDVPMVPPTELARIFRIAVAQERGLLLLTGIDPAALQRIENEYWQARRCAPEVAGAAILRFRALILVFEDRRLGGLLLDRGLPLLPVVFRSAARMRLDLTRGFRAARLLSSVAGQQSGQPGAPLRRASATELFAA